ncbi:MAG TPA: protoporphyrinogen oxidase [Silvibacterium sp.]|nr:protoporphyrinogen oxidase [Silvibacterium sp.]
MKRVAIIGGGLSGLAAAYQLAQESGVEFTLFEASKRLGGTVETVHRDGFVIECGPDSWVTEKPWARDLAVELGLEAEIIASNDRWRRTYLLENNRLVPMPDGMRMMVPTRWAPIMESPLFSWQAKLAYLREARLREELKQSALADSEDESVASFVRRHFGDEVAGTIAGPLLSGVFGGSIDALSVRAVMPAFVKLEKEHGSLIAGLQQRQEAGSAAVFTSLKPGLGTLIERVAHALPGNAVRLEHEVRSFLPQDGQWRIEASGAKDLFDAVIVATPAHVTRRLLGPVSGQFDDLLTMDASSAIVVALAFSAERARHLRIPRGFGYLVPQKTTAGRRLEDNPPLLACTFVDQKFSCRAPDGAVLLRGFFGGDAAPALLHESDSALISLAHRQLSRALGQLPEPDISLVRRWPLSLPQYAVGHLDRMARLAEAVTGFPGLYLVGNAYYGVGLPDLVRQGREVARQAARE